MTSSPTTTTGRLLTAKQVCEQLALSRSTFFRMLADGTFPAPVRPRPRMTRWTQPMVDGYLAQATAGAR